MVVYEGHIVGYAATMILPEERALKQHSWLEVTGGGYAAMHDRKGDWLYGTEICVDPDRRRLRIGKRLYDARRRLCQDLDLKGIAFGGRMPGYQRNKKKYGSPEAYLKAIKKNEAKDPVATFHLNSGFEPEGLLKDYYPSDTGVRRLRRPDGLAQSLLRPGPRGPAGQSLQPRRRSGSSPSRWRRARFPSPRTSTTRSNISLRSPPNTAAISWSSRSSSR